MLSCTCAVTAVAPMINKRVDAAKQMGSARFMAMFIVTDPFRNGPSWAMTAPHARGAGVCLAGVLYHTNDCTVKVVPVDNQGHGPHPIHHTNGMLGIARVRTPILSDIAEIVVGIGRLSG